MRGRTLALGFALALCVVVLTRGAGPTVPWAVPNPRGEASTPAEEQPGPPPTMPEPPARNPFEYADQSLARATAAAAPVAARSHMTSLATPLPAPVLRLVGLVRRGGALAAALALAGDVVVVGEGESVDAYSVLSVEEEIGVRLRGPDGAEIVLPVPPP